MLLFAHIRWPWQVTKSVYLPTPVQDHQKMFLLHTAFDFHRHISLTDRREQIRLSRRQRDGEGVTSLIRFTSSDPFEVIGRTSSSLSPLSVFSSEFANPITVYRFHTV